MTKRISMITFLLCALCLLSFAALAEARKVQVAVPGFSQNMAFSAAKLAGYYQAEDLDVEFVLMSAGTAVQALIGGSVDFALVGGAAVTAILRGGAHQVHFGFFLPARLFRLCEAGSTRGKRSQRQETRGC